MLIRAIEKLLDRWQNPSHYIQAVELSDWELVLIDGILEGVYSWKVDEMEFIAWESQYGMMNYVETYIIPYVGEVIVRRTLSKAPYNGCLEETMLWLTFKSAVGGVTEHGVQIWT